MKHYRAIITPFAGENIREAHEWLEAENPTYVAKWLSGIEFTNQRAHRTAKNALQRRVAAGAAFMQLPGGQQRGVDRSAELFESRQLPLDGSTPDTSEVDDLGDKKALFRLPEQQAEQALLGSREKCVGK